MIIYRPLAFGLLILMSGLGFQGCHTDKQRQSAAPADRQKHAKEFRNEDDWIGAYRAVQETIRKQLDSSEPLRFPWDDSADITRDSSSQRYLVQGYFLQTSDGGITHQVSFRAYAFQYQDDLWEVYDLEIDTSR